MYILIHIRITNSKTDLRGLKLFYDYFMSIQDVDNTVYKPLIIQEHNMGLINKGLIGPNC